MTLSKRLRAEERHVWKPANRRSRRWPQVKSIDPKAGSRVQWANERFLASSQFGIKGLTTSLRWPTGTTTKIESCAASGWRNICASPFVTGTRFAGPDPTFSAEDRFTPDG